MCAYFGCPSRCRRRDFGGGDRLAIINQDPADASLAADASINEIEHPDILVFDLDPGEGVAWEFVIETALTLRRILKDEGLEPWPKLTGGKGLHLMAPLDRRIDHDEARAYAKRVAQRLAATAPDRYTLASAPDKRAGRIFIDYLRNGRGTTAIGAWSPRARGRGFRSRRRSAGARSRTGVVRMPLRWRGRRGGSRWATADLARRRT